MSQNLLTKILSKQFIQALLPGLVAIGTLFGFGENEVVSIVSGAVIVLSFISSFIISKKFNMEQFIQAIDDANNLLDQIKKENASLKTDLDQAKSEVATMIQYSESLKPVVECTTIDAISSDNDDENKTRTEVVYTSDGSYEVTVDVDSDGNVTVTSVIPVGDIACNNTEPTTNQDPNIITIGDGFSYDKTSGTVNIDGNIISLNGDDISISKKEGLVNA